jgi:hypothetical protein
MSQTENKEIAAQFGLKGIELLNGVINTPPIPFAPITNYNFNINLESKVDATSEFIFVIVNIDIKTEDQSLTLGSLSVSCIYHITNFNEVVKLTIENRFQIPQALVELLNAISISTTRGVMFSTFKGTFLHNALLPIVDPSQLKQL